MARAAAERSTGYVIGGISPLGQRRPLPIVVDDSVHAWDVALAPADLVRLTKVVTVDILAR